MAGSQSATLARSASLGIAPNHRARRRLGLGLRSLLALVALTATCAFSQEPAQSGRAASRPEVEANEPGGSEYAGFDPGSANPARYDEPGMPPFDYWQPTWMPCQSLRTNRSLVLGHMYFGMDIMGWSTKGVHAPPLVTTSSVANGGVIGQGDTAVAFGDQTFHKDMRPGGKLTIGWWFDPNQTSGIEWHYFELDGHNIRFDADRDNGASNGFLGRPIIDTNSGLASAVATASDVLNGSIDIRSNMQLTSTGILYRDLFWSSQYARADYLVGYRHAHLADRLNTRESLTALDDSSGFTDGDTVTRLDQFRAINQFDGVDLGLRGWWSNNGKLALTGIAKVALGASNNDVLINGSTAVKSGGTTTTTNGGVLALPSNIGHYTHQKFGTLAEVGGGLEWQPVCQFKFSLGYTWFYWSDVARAVNQIDTTVNTNQLAPANGSGNRPAFDLHTTSFWAQGLNAGFAYQF